MKKNSDFNDPFSKANSNSDFFDEDAYSFIRSISTPSEEQTKKKPHKKRYAVIFLIVFSVLFVAVVRHTYLSSDNITDNSIDNHEYPPHTTDTPMQNILSDSEINEKLRLFSQSDIRYAEIYENKEKFPEDMLQAVCRNPEVVDFAVGYLSSDGKGSGELTENDITDDVPLFIQWDSRWGYIPYGDNIIGLSGCGPTCLSMVAVSLTGDLKYSPSYIANFSMKQGYYEPNSGTTWALITDGCSEFGLQAEELPLNYNDMVNVLDDGKPIICSMNPGDFTAVGHFIVIKGVEDGDFIINDPNSRSRSSKRWSYEELEWQIRNLWCFSVP